MATPVILIVEPNKLLVQAYQSAFEAEGFKVNQASSAQTAISSADTQKPDLVVLEIQLNKHNGIEFLYEFRSYYEWQSIPVVINSDVSPSKFAKSKQQLKLLGINQYLYKPKTSITKLVQTVRSELER